MRERRTRSSSACFSSTIGDAYVFCQAVLIRIHEEPYLTGLFESCKPLQVLVGLAARFGLDFLDRVEVLESDVRNPGRG